MLQIHVVCCHPNYFKPLLKEYQWYISGGGGKYEKTEEKWRTYLNPLQMWEVTEMQSTFNMLLQAQEEQEAIIWTIQFWFYCKCP